MRIVNKLFKTLYSLMIAGVILFALLLIVPVLPIQNNYQVRVVLSGSMEPSIKTGSVVFVKPEASYGPGDVITFYNSSIRDDKGKAIPVTHRVIEFQKREFESGFITKGDANDSVDSGLVNKNNVLGKVFLTIPYLGYLIEAARQPYGFLALIMIPALIIIYDETVKIVKEIKKMRSMKQETRVVKLKIEVIS